MSEVDPKLFRLAFEQTKDYAVFLLDSEGHILTWNLGAQRLKGYAPEDIIGQHFSKFYMREAVDSGWPWYELKMARADGRFEDEGWRVRKDGSRFWANVVITALRDEHGNLLGFSKITRDLTERRQHEEALRQSEERFRLLIEGVVDYAVFMLDPEGYVSSWNLGAQRIKGYLPADIIGKHFSRFFTDEDVEAGKPWQELATARREGRVEAEGWRVKKNGEHFWARSVVSALRDERGKLRGFAKVTQDLTDRRHIQDLERAARHVNEFIAILAHELRNPLAPIRSAVEVMAKLPATDPRQALMRETISRQSAQLMHIVDDMLDINRITRGELVIEQRVIDITEVAKQAAETAAPAIQAGNHVLHVKEPAEPLFVNADSYRLVQIISNLLNNASRYTPSGGTITLSVRAEDKDVVVSVADTGRGISAEWMDRIFDMFVHGRPLVERIGGGLGIGLALGRRLAEMHGGSLTAHSAGEGQGSEFSLRLPNAASRPATVTAAQPGPAAAAPEAVAQRILIVDDNVDAATSLGLLLQSLGHQTRVAHDGPQALSAISEFVPELVLLDIGLPGMDGYEVARRLRALELGQRLRIVALSGWGQATDVQKSRDAGFDLHLVKPVSADDLKSVLTSQAGATLH